MSDQYISMKQSHLNQFDDFPSTITEIQSEQTINIKKKKPKKIGLYSFQEQQIIGKGYTSTVYKGIKQTQNGPLQVAIKQISLNNIDDLHYNLLKNQIRIVKLLNNEHIVKVHDVVLSKNNCYIIMQLCENGTLETHINRGLRNQQKMHIIKDLIAGMQYLEQQKIIHRDIKPQNILLGNDNKWKFTDFGFAVEQSIINNQKVSVGSLLYMAPEVSKYSEYSVKSDIFSLGLVFYQLIHNGQLPQRRHLRTNKNQQNGRRHLVKLSSLINFEQSQEFNMSQVKLMLQKQPSNRPNPQDLSIFSMLQQIQEEQYQQSILYKDILPNDQKFIAFCNQVCEFIKFPYLRSDIKLKQVGQKVYQKAYYHISEIFLVLKNKSNNFLNLTQGYFLKKLQVNIKSIQKPQDIQTNAKSLEFCEELKMLINSLIQTIQSSQLLQKVIIKHSTTPKPHRIPIQTIRLSTGRKSLQNKQDIKSMPYKQLYNMLKTYYGFLEAILQQCKNHKGKLINYINTHIEKEQNFLKEKN